MAGDSTVKVNFIGDSSSLKRAVDESDGHLSRLGDGIGKFAKVAAVGLGAAAVGLGVFAKSALDAAYESQKISAQTEAVIKSTGAAAQVTAKQVASLATAISNKTGVDDEAIQSGQNLLLTFTNLQNRAGKGNDIFNQATQAMVDMSAAMGTDASSTAIQLGKALNDPVKGITALTRVGVTFSDAQKKQIKTMQEAGDVAGAQKVILAELTKEFGGSAAAQATAAQKMKVAFGNLQEQIGGMLIPVVEKLSVFLAEKIIPAMSKLAERVMPVLADAAKEVILAVQLIVFGFRNMDRTSDGFHGKMEEIGIVLRRVFDWARENIPPVLAVMRDAFLVVADIIMTKFWPAIKATFDFLMEHKEILVGIGVTVGILLVAAFIAWAAATWALVAAQVALAVAFVTANFWIIAIAAAVGALVAGIIYAYKHWGWFHDAVDKAWQILQSTFDWVKEHWPLVLVILTGPIGAAVVLIIKHWDTIKNTFTAVFDWVKEHWPLVLAILTGPIGLAVLAIVTHWDTIKNGFTAVKDWISEKIGDIVGFFTELPGKITTAASGAFNGLKEAFRSAINFIIRSWNSLDFTIPGFDPPGPGPKIPSFTLGMPDISELAMGGIVTRPTLALLGERGPEAVVPLSRMGGGTNNTYNITVNALDSRSAADAVIRAISEYENRNGFVPIRRIMHRNAS